MLRCIPDAQAFATMLQKAWTQATGKVGVSLAAKEETIAPNWQLAVGK
jgi:hypothetical protein